MTPPAQSVDYARRRDRLRMRFADAKIDSLLISDPVHVRYLTGFTGDSSYLWLAEADELLLSDGRFTTQIRDQCGDQLRVGIRSPDTKMHQMVAASFDKSRHGKRIGIEGEHLTVAVMNQLGEALAMPLVATSDLVAKLRMIKDAWEVSAIKRSIEVAEQALHATCLTGDGFRFEGTERELAFELEAEMRRRGATGTSFDPIIAKDAAAALPHYQPADVSLAGAKVILVDWGAMLDGYASDLTRTFHDGNAGEEFESVYEAVLEAHDASVAALQVGTEVSAIDAAARECLRRHGLADHFVHCVGHGFGLRVHESPRMAAGETLQLAAGMVVTIEPGVYLPDRFGVRLENDFLVTEDGPTLLSDGIAMGLEKASLID